MKSYLVYEKMFPNWGEPYTAYVGIIQARNEQSALNKAKREFRWENHGGEYGAYSRRRRPENMFVKVLY